MRWFHAKFIFNSIFQAFSVSYFCGIGQRKEEIRREIYANRLNSRVSVVKSLIKSFSQKSCLTLCIGNIKRFLLITYLVCLFGWNYWRRLTICIEDFLKNIKLNRFSVYSGRLWWKALTYIRKGISWVGQIAWGGTAWAEFFGLNSSEHFWFKFWHFWVEIFVWIFWWENFGFGCSIGKLFRDLTFFTFTKHAQTLFQLPQEILITCLLIVVH